MCFIAAGAGDIYGQECGRVMENSATVMSEIEMPLMLEMRSKTSNIEGI